MFAVIHVVVVTTLLAVSVNGADDTNALDSVVQSLTQQVSTLSAKVAALEAAQGKFFEFLQFNSI
jgi:outer membrane murein-binding lipoprotein Lpp